MKTAYLILHTVICIFVLVAVYEIVRLNDENVRLSEAEKYCRISFNNSIADVPCTVVNDNEMKVSLQ